jgi:hypothetical protein
MDDKGKDKSNLGNDQKLDREKNPVTGVKTTDQILEHKKSNNAPKKEDSRPEEQRGQRPKP